MPSRRRRSSTSAASAETRPRGGAERVVRVTLGIEGGKRKAIESTPKALINGRTHEEDARMSRVMDQISPRAQEFDAAEVAHTGTRSRGDKPAAHLPRQEQRRA